MQKNSTPRLSLFISLLFVSSFLISQTTAYRAVENEHYWQNRTHNSDYWQQDVHYTIKAEIDKDKETISCSEYTLVYYNNSPDTLDKVYFHLFQNAFTPHSHMHDLYENNDWNIEFGEKEAKGLGTQIENLKINNKEVKTTLDNTILNATLNAPLLPQDSIVITCSFTTYFDNGTLRRRMKEFQSTNGNKHFDGVHWYPSIAVYDRKFGWTTEQHLDKEFYHNFGQFDIELNFPNEYIVDATGTLLNPEEVFQDSLREQIDIKHFATKGEHSFTIKAIDDSTKTWKYHAINVHNFAFTADPTYRIGEIEWNGIKVVTLAQEKNAYKWQKSGEFTKEVIRIYSEDFGMYAWPKIIVADAQDGMEYPMLTLDGGGFPSHRGLLAHEVGHMWFYGMIGSNETYRAFMDEGFTQFLTVWSMDKIIGETYPKSTSGYKHVKKHKTPNNNRYDKLYYPYLTYTWEGVDHQLNTHSSDFNGAVRHNGGYGLVYFKTGVMLYNLRYVLGEQLFEDAMKNYFDTWKMRHPYPEDFRNTIIAFTKVDLNWFFDQWLETTKYIDYSIKKVKKNTATSHTITFERIGEMQMPIDFTVYTKSGDTLQYHIPNTWFQKETEATILPKWYGWGNIHRTYEVTLDDIEIKNIEIDPAKYLADIDLSNNRWKNADIIAFDHRVPNKSNWFNKEIYWRPDVWYNKVDGIQLGLHLESNYMQRKHKTTFDLWANTQSFDQSIYTTSSTLTRPVAFKITNFNFLKPFNYRVRHSETLQYIAGVFKSNIAVSKDFRKQGIRNPNYTKVTLSHTTLYDENVSRANEYAIYDNAWGNKRNHYIELQYHKHKGYSDEKKDLKILLHTPGVLGEYDYSFVQMSFLNKTTLKYFDVNARLFTRLGNSFSGDMPNESQLGISGASIEDMYNYKFTRASGTLPTDVMDYFHLGGGLNMRGFSDMMTVDGTYLTAISGSSANIELDFTRVFKPHRTYRKRFYFNTYAFTDVGVYHNGTFSEQMTDMGLGFSATWRHKFLRINPITLRIEYPMVVRYGDTDVSNQQMIIGLGKVF